MFLRIQKNSRGAEGKNKKTPDPFSDSFPTDSRRFSPTARARRHLSKLA